MKNKLIYFIICLSLSLLISCGNKDVTDKNDGKENGTESVLFEGENNTENVNGTEIEATTEEVDSSEADTSETMQEQPATSYTYTDLNKTMYAKSNVNLRDLPSADGNKIGALSKAQEITVTGQCNETNWYRIIYDGSVAYVSNNYLVDTKPNVETTNNDTVNSGGTYYTEANGYEYGWHPMGDHAPNYEIENEIGTHCCVIVHNVHYEVTPEVGKKVFLAGESADIHDWEYGYWAWDEGDGYVGVHVPNYFYQTLTYEEYEFHCGDRYTFFDSYESYSAARLKYIEDARYEELMNCGYIRILR